MRFSAKLHSYLYPSKPSDCHSIFFVNAIPKGDPSVLTLYEGR